MEAPSPGLLPTAEGEKHQAAHHVGDPNGTCLGQIQSMHAPNSQKELLPPVYSARSLWAATPWLPAGGISAAIRDGLESGITSNDGCSKGIESWH